jgi:hypothetical protein
METIQCPQTGCTEPARIVGRWTWDSTHGPVRHIKTGCKNNHWLTTVEDDVVTQAERILRNS